MPDLYQLRVVLRDVSPLIWRRLLVHSDTNIAELHAVLQTAMGWTDTHLHRFRIHGKAYGIAHRGGISFADDPFEIRLRDFRLHRGERFVYEYDFMDGWVVGIRVEKILPLDAECVYLRCTAGQRATPPEECGGPWAYLSELDQRELRGWEVLEQLIETVQSFGATGDRLALDDEELSEALDDLEAHLRLRPDQFDRKAVNAKLRDLAKDMRGAA